MYKRKMGKKALLPIMPVVLVGSKDENAPNFMTVSMTTVVSSNPAIVVIAVAPLRKSYSSIKKNKTFSINIPDTKMLEVTDFCGIFSSKKIDKSSNFEVFYGDLETAPMIRECKTNLECKLISTLKTGNHDLFIGEINESYVDIDCLSNEGKIDLQKQDPVLFNLDGMNYWNLNNSIGRVMNVGKNYQNNIKERI